MADMACQRLMPSSAVRRPRGTSLHGDRWQTSQKEGQHREENSRPMATRGGAQRGPARTADQAARNREGTAPVRAICHVTVR